MLLATLTCVDSHIFLKRTGPKIVTYCSIFVNNHTKPPRLYLGGGDYFTIFIFLFSFVRFCTNDITDQAKAIHTASS